MDKITKLLPLIYPLLIFSGYLDYVTYYRQFHLSIVSYLTTTELLLSFLNITAPLLYLVLIGSIYFLVELSAIGSGRKDQTSVNPEPELTIYIYAFPKIYKEILADIKIFKLNFKTIFFLILNVVRFFVSVALLVFFVFYFFVLMPLLVDSKVIPGVLLSSSFALSFIWFSLLLNIVTCATFKMNKPHSINIFLGASIITFLSLIAIYNKQEASKILEGISKYEVILSQNDKVIKTDSNFLYVGKTEKYFFFFDRKNYKNAIYPAEQITMIELKKIE